MPTEDFSTLTPRSRWTPLWSSVPPLLLLGLGMALGSAPQAPHNNPAPEEHAEALTADGFVPRSQTMVVEPRQAAGYSLLRGQLKPVVNAVGESPLAAQITRVAVRPGQQVSVGDEILALSTGLTSKASHRAETSERVAESSQVAAAKKQDALQAKMRDAQERLVEARKRVAAAQQRVTAVREMVLNLRRGGSEAAAAPPQAPPTTVRRPATETVKSPAADKEQARLEAARRDALRDAKKAQGVVEQAESKVLVARRTAEATNKELEAKKQKVRDARESAAKAQALFDAAKAKGSDVEAARAALEDAEADVKEATAKSAAALQEAQRLETLAADARSQAKKATARVVQSLQSLQLFAQSTPPESASPTDAAPAATGNDGAPPTVAEATQQARAALAESEAAIAAADDIQREIDGYRRQVSTTRQRLETTSSNLESAQHRVVDTNIREGLASVRAPASGTILWVAEVADEVTPGEALVAVGQPGLWEARLTDSSGVWKALKTGMKLPAMVQRAASSEDGSPTNSKGLAHPASLQAAPPMAGTPTLARLDSIIPPERPGAPAVLKVVVTDSPGANNGEGRFRAGMVLLCSVSLPGRRATISIPSTAVLQDADGRQCVAVLAPVGSAGAPPAATGNTAQLHRIEWRQITTGRGDGIQQEIISGLLPGERIALAPQDLESLTLARGAGATVRLGDVS